MFRIYAKSPFESGLSSEIHFTGSLPSGIRERISFHQLALIRMGLDTLNKQLPCAGLVIHLLGNNFQDNCKIQSISHMPIWNNAAAFHFKVNGTKGRGVSSNKQAYCGLDNRVVEQTPGSLGIRTNSR